MTQLERMVAVAIGVRDAKPLDYLPAALNGARDFSRWALALGYETHRLTDEATPLTVKRLSKELESALEGKPIHRLVLYFAGHGLIREAEEGLWLLSDWHDELRAVAIDPLRRRLARYNIKQIAIFADCCRSLPNDMDAADLTADAVLGFGPGPKADPEIDKFVAAQDGSETFAIPGDREDEDRAIFSGVLLEGLWGTRPAAFSVVTKDRITSRSLGKYLRETVPLVAARYGKTVSPSVSPTFSEGDDVYYRDGHTPARPKFPEWPPAVPLPPDDPPPSMTVNVGTVQVLGLGGIGNPGAVFLDDEIVVQGDVGLPSTTMLDRLRAQERPDGFETGAGFAVEGEPIRRFWTSNGVFAEPHGDENWWRVGEAMGERLNEPASILIEFEDDRFAAVAALPGFVTTVTCDARGVSALVYRRAYSMVGAGMAERAIDLLERGALRSDDATDLAVQLRIEKHVDPVLGVISAYLYDSIGDIDSIRRMAYYYTMHGQPIPYDVALLAQLSGVWDGTKLRADVPQVAGRAPRSEAERAFEWTYVSTPHSGGTVGGLWPWMRQGWAFLTDPADDGSTLVLPGIIELTDELTSGRFTTMKTEGARELVKLLQLIPQDPPNPPSLSKRALVAELR